MECEKATPHIEEVFAILLAIISPSDPDTSASIKP
jgi:hypothetical protein